MEEKASIVYQFIIIIAIVVFAGWELYTNGEMAEYLIGAIIGVMGQPIIVSTTQKVGKIISKDEVE